MNMVDIMSQMFAVVGLDINQPITLSVLFPYLLKVSMAFCLVGVILRSIANFSLRFMGGKL